MNKFNAFLESVGKDFEFDEGEHRYFYQGQSCLSVTTLIDSVLTGEQMNYLKRIMNMSLYAEIGKRIHFEIEQTLLGREVDYQYEEHVIKAITFLKRDFPDIEIFHPEVKIIDKELLLAGTIDILGYSKAKKILYIIDWKTSSQKVAAHAIQQQIYAYIIKKWWLDLFKEEIEIRVYCVYIPRNERIEAKIHEHSPRSAITNHLLAIHKWKLNNFKEYWKYGQ